MNSMKKIIFILLIFFVSLGYSAILKWPEDCVDYGGSEKVCYHQVAMSYALTGNIDEAVKYCYLIYDSGVFTKSQMNRCFKDVAIMATSNPETKENAKDICELMMDTVTDLGILDTEKEVCRKEVEGELDKSTDCKIAYILPIIILGSLFFRSFVH